MTAEASVLGAPACGVEWSRARWTCGAARVDGQLSNSLSLRGKSPGASEWIHAVCPVRSYFPFPSRDNSSKSLFLKDVRRPQHRGTGIERFSPRGRPRRARECLLIEKPRGGVYDRPFVPPIAEEWRRTGGAMTELAKEAFTSRNYHLAVELYERCLKQQGSSYEVLLGYGDSLIRCGRVRESIEIYSRCLGAMSVPAERLKHLATALLDDMVGVATGSARRRPDASFVCPVCEGTLCQPVTAGCGHTYCRSCVEPSKNCRVCGVKIAAVSETNVLVQRLVERWWPGEAEASRARHQGDILVRKGHLGQALERYNLAVHLGK